MKLLSSLLVLPLATALLLLSPASARAQTAAPPQAPAGARRLTLRQAIEQAIGVGSEIQIASQGVEASAARVRGAGAQRFPQLKVEGNVLYWDKPLDLAFVMPGMMMPGQSVPVLRVREQTTAQVTVTLAQPISALLVLHRLIALERNGEEAAKADQLKARLDTAQRASEAYLRLLQARAFLAVAEKSVAQVEAQLQRAQISEKAGALAQVDVLRLTSARDTARQGLLRARAGAQIAQTGLVLALELPPGTDIEVVDDLPDPPVRIVLDEDQATTLALRERPELRAATERLEQAMAGRSVAKAALLPNILGIGTYQRTEGQSTFQPKNALFVGATLSWDVWDWGKRWSGVKEAEAKANQAAIARRVQGEQVAFDAGRRLIETRTAFDTLALASSGLAAAEEAYRIQSVRYAEGAATTTDLIDAETDVFRARSSHAQSRYDYYLAQAALARAVGRMPQDLNGRTP
jgi:outer membrane protein